MRYLITLFLSLSALTAFSQGAVDRLELGYQTTRRGIVWVRPGLPTHEPAWRISRDTNSIMWHNLTTGIRYDWSYDAGVWYTRDFIASTLPPLDVFTSGAATIDNTQATWINDDGVLHHYSQAEGAWLPDKISFQSAGPTDIAAGVSNGAAVYTTSLWQDSDTYLVYYWDGDSWELFGISLSGTTNYLPKWVAPGTSLSSTSNVYDDGGRVGIRTSSPTAALNIFSPIDTAGIKLNYAYKIGNSVSAISVLNQDALETFALGANRTANEGILTLRSPSVQGSGTGINFSSNNGATARTGLFQLDNSGNMIFRQSQSSMFYDYFDNVYFRDNTFTTRMQLYNQYLNVGTTFSNAARMVVKGPGSTSSTATISAINSASTQLLYVRDDGNIGIATASPAQTLHVAGTARITGSAGTATTAMGRDGNGDISALSLSGMSISGGTLTATDGSTTNELQTLANTSDATSHTVTLSNSGGSFQLVEGSGVTLTTTGTSSDGIITIAASGASTDLTFSGTSSPITLNSSTGTDVTFTAGTGITLAASSTNTTITNSAPDQTVSITNGGGVSVTGTYPNFTLTATDQSVTNEGVLGVGAGSATSSTIISNTSGATGVTINVAGILAISESTSSNGGSITITGTEVDGSVTNEAQTLSVSGTTSGILTLSTAGGAGGGTATIASGTGISVAQSGGTITITNSSPATAGWLIDGNTIAATRRIGSNDNFDVVVETNNTDRMWFDNAGTVSIGATQLTTAQLNINGFGTTGGTGMLIAGGGSLVGPNFYTATGSGTGSTATVLSGVLSMISGNVEALLKNTATTGTGGGSVITLNVSPTATSNDPFIKWQTEATTDWSMGIDNDNADVLKLHRFSRPSDNNGVGTIEYGYNGTSIGFSMNKNGVLSGSNFYGIDVLGKIRGDLFVNNIAVANGTVALGSSAGTSPTLDNTVTTWWGNGGRVKFTSGSSGLAANSTLFTITMDPDWKFINNGAPIVYAGSASAAGINTNASYVASTGVITCTLSGTLTASTSYEFNVSMTGN